MHYVHLRTLNWLGKDNPSYLHVGLRSDGAVATNERAANLSEAVGGKGHKQGAQARGSKRQECIRLLLLLL